MTNFSTLEKIITKKVERAYSAWMNGDDSTTKASLYQAAMLAQKNNIYTMEDDVNTIFGDFINRLGDFATN